MSILTMKFGGTSVGSVDALNQSADIVIKQVKNGKKVPVIVSAMSGVTNELIKGAESAAAGDDISYLTVVDKLTVLHHSTIEKLSLPRHERKKLIEVIDQFLKEFTTFCHSVYVLGEVTPRAMDAIVSYGERMNTRTFAALLRSKGIKSDAIDATELIVSDSGFQDAVPLMQPTQSRVSEKLAPLLKNGIVPVITGFIAANEAGITTTLGRGGSDYSAAIIGACLKSDEVWIWTDVDGVMTADIRSTPNAQSIPVLSYSEIGELAYFGAKVLHPKTIRPVIENNIPLWVKNTFNPDHPGTEIVSASQNSKGTVKAVTMIKGMSMLTVEGRGMIGVPGIAARTFSAVARCGASVLMISQSSSEQSICFVIPTNTVEKVIRSIQEELSLELSRKDVDRVWSQDEVVIVTAVGAGMRGTPGVAARVFGALGNGNINVIAVAQGSSECSISLVVKSESAIQAVNQIHNEVIIHEKN